MILIRTRVKGAGRPDMAANVVAPIRVRYEYAGHGCLTPYLIVTGTFIRVLGASGSLLQACRGLLVHTIPRG